MRGSIRRLAAAAALVGALLTWPATAAATITGGCTGTGTATSSSVDLTTATEWHVKKADVGGGQGQGPAAKSGSVGAYALGIRIPIASGTDPVGKTTGSVDGVSVSWFAILGHIFTVAGSADNGCAGQITIIIDDQDPLFTVLGGGGALLGVLGGLLVLRTMRGGRGIGKRLLDTVYGVVGGTGAALAAEQFEVIDATSFLGLAIVTGAAAFAFLTCGILGGGKKKPPVVSGSAPAPVNPSAPVGARAEPGPTMPAPGSPESGGSHTLPPGPDGQAPVGGGDAM
jgi:hypothetical protein